MNNERDFFGDANASPVVFKKTQLQEAAEFEVMDGVVSTAPVPEIDVEPVIPRPMPVEREYIDAPAQIHFRRKRGGKGGRAMSLAKATVPGNQVGEVASALSSALRANQEKGLEEARSMTPEALVAKERLISRRRLCYVGAALAIVGTGGYVARQFFDTVKHAEDRVFNSVDHLFAGLSESKRPTANITIEGVMKSVSLSGNMTMVESYGTGSASIKRQENTYFNIPKPWDWHEAAFSKEGYVDMDIDGSTLRFLTQPDVKGGYDGIVEADPANIKPNLVNVKDATPPQIHSGSVWKAAGIFFHKNEVVIDSNTETLAEDSLRSCGEQDNPLLAYGLANQVKMRLKTGIDFLESEHNVASDQGAKMLEQLYARPLIIRFMTLGKGAAKAESYDIFNIKAPFTGPKIPSDTQIAKNIGLKNTKKLTISVGGGANGESCEVSSSTVNSFVKIIGNNTLVAPDPLTTAAAHP